MSFSVVQGFCCSAVIEYLAAGSRWSVFLAYFCVSEDFRFFLETQEDCRISWQM